MSIAKVFSAQPDILGATLVTVEVDISRGLHSFSVVGLPGKAVEEARDRVAAAIRHSGFPSPKSKNHKIIISLAPADVKKEGPLYDVPMALAYLLAAEEIHFDSTEKLFVGELGLDGTIRPIHGALTVAQAAASNGMKELYVPLENVAEASLVDGVSVFGVPNLLSLIRHLDAKHEDHALLPAIAAAEIVHEAFESAVRLEDIRGQEGAKRGLILAAAGRHNTLMVGPPGTGKTMLARAFEGILPPLTRDEALEVTAIHSVSGTLDTFVIARPPFRAPHHTASHTSLVGGGTHPRPGEVTLAHRGVLFLDEFPEFERRSIDALRQPLEDRVVRVTRVSGTATFPSDFILLAAMNPHRGGYEAGDVMDQVTDDYKKKISGPILDRIDLSITVTHINPEALSEKRVKKAETEQAREIVARARERQVKRLVGRNARANAEMTARDIEETIELTDGVRNILNMSATKLSLSPRSIHRTVKVARTIADLADSDHIEESHLLEALQYRVRL